MEYLGAFRLGYGTLKVIIHNRKPPDGQQVWPEHRSSSKLNKANYKVITGM